GSGTMLVRDLDSGPGPLINVGGTLYFAASESEVVTGHELWKSDGTSAGTVQVADLNPGSADSNPFLFDLDGRLFFTATNHLSGTELWSLDTPRILGTSLRVMDPAPGVNPSLRRIVV